VNGAPAGSTVVITDALTDDAPDDAIVVTYTSKANRPMSIMNCVVRDKNNKDIPVDVEVRDNYVDLTDKTSDGKVNQVWYDPQISAGLLYVWPQSSVETDRLVIWSQRTLSDFDAASDDADYPQEWFLALSFNLASTIKHKYGVPVQRGKDITAMAEHYLDIASGFDRSDSVYIEPDME